jgi:Phytanoyl-CoA dioxygenase (PhyH)
VSVSSFAGDGFVSLGVVFPPEECRALKTEVLRTRDFRDVFLTEEKFRRNPQRRGTNPRPGRNLLARIDPRFIFFNQRFNEEMVHVVGPHKRILDYVLVAAIPHHYLPDWIKAETENVPANNLGPFIKEEYRDITYFTGIDFHQDILDFPYRDADFVTAYVYLDKVTTDTAPLIAVPRSHELGVTIFPHKIKLSPSGLTLLYENDLGITGEYEWVEVIGDAGSLAYWHCATLHGTRPQKNDSPRISVRILVEKNSREPDTCELDRANQLIKGELSLEKIRVDIDKEGKSVVRENRLKRFLESQ